MNIILYSLVLWQNINYFSPLVMLPKIMIYAPKYHNIYYNKHNYIINTCSTVSYGEFLSKPNITIDI